MAEVYTIKVTYQDCDDRIWRVAEVSSNATLADIGYLILATFRTNAYHLFQIDYNGITFDLRSEEEAVADEVCANIVKLSQLEPPIGTHMEMIYDFGLEQVFDIEIIAIAPMGIGKGRAYPRIIDGAGRGIIDDMSAEDLLNIIKNTDRTGHSDFTYITDLGKEMTWDYRDYRINYDKIMLKGEIELIREGYEQL